MVWFPNATRSTAWFDVETMIDTVLSALLAHWKSDAFKSNGGKADACSEVPRRVRRGGSPQRTCYHLYCHQL
jgi:hypothetical protein